MKLCRACHKEKPDNEFPRGVRAKPVCLACRAAISLRRPRPQSLALVEPRRALSIATVVYQMSVSKEGAA
jgi:hypothetical protein